MPKQALVSTQVIEQDPRHTVGWAARFETVAWTVLTCGIPGKLTFGNLFQGSGVAGRAAARGELRSSGAPPEPRAQGGGTKGSAELRVHQELLRTKGSVGAGGTGGGSGASGAWGGGGVGGSGEFLRLCGLRLVVGGKGVVVRTVEVRSSFG